jgi:DNA invertase Pin-like site-specific DNA recombinase
MPSSYDARVSRPESSVGQVHWGESGESESGFLRHGFAELLIDCEEDRTFRAVLVGMLRDVDRIAEGLVPPALRRP